ARFATSWRTFSRNLVLGAGRSYRMAPSGGRPGAGLESTAKSVAILFRSRQEAMPRVSFIGVRTASVISLVCAKSNVWSHAWHVAARKTAANSTRAFDSVLLKGCYSGGL